MRIIQLASGRVPTGPVAAALLDARALQAAGHTVWVLTGDVPRLEQACKAEGLLHLGGLKLGRGAQRLLTIPRDARNLRALLRELAADVLHVHRSEDQLLGAAAIGRASVVRLVRTWHRAPARFSSLLLRKLAAGPAGSVCVAREHEETLKAAGSSACAFIHPAADTETFRPAAPEKAELAAVPVLAQAGRWKREEDRGQRAALRVFALLDRTLAWQGVLAGRGEREAELNQLAHEELQLPRERVRVLHFARQSPQDFAQLLSSFSLGLVFAPGSDGTSRAAVEMLACGVPIAVASRPGLSELAEDRSCAVRLLPDDPAGWARAIETLLRQPGRLAEMGRAARTRAEQAHALPVRGAALGEFYRSI